MVNQKPIDYYSCSEKGHGRHSSWYVSVYDVIPSNITDQWKDIRRIIHVHKQTKEKGKVTDGDRLYISNLFETSAQFYHEGIRGHWTIENSLHWVKDVVHNEDNNQIKNHNGAINYAVFSSISINIQRKNGHRSVTENQMELSANIQETLKMFWI